MNSSINHGPLPYLHSVVPRRVRVNFIRYSDDSIITGKSKRLLEKRVKPAVERFLEKRGLSLSEEKTVITHIRNGFTFLGQTFRRHGMKLHIYAIKRGNQSPDPEGGSVDQKIRRFADDNPDNEAESSASWLG